MVLLESAGLNVTVQIFFNIPSLLPERVQCLEPITIPPHAVKTFANAPGSSFTPDYMWYTQIRRNAYNINLRASYCIVTDSWFFGSEAEEEENVDWGYGRYTYQGLDLQDLLHKTKANIEVSFEMSSYKLTGSLPGGYGRLSYITCWGT